MKIVGIWITWWKEEEILTSCKIVEEGKTSLNTGLNDATDANVVDRKKLLHYRIPKHSWNCFKVYTLPRLIYGIPRLVYGITRRGGKYGDHSSEMNGRFHKIEQKWKSECIFIFETLKLRTIGYIYIYICVCIYVCELHHHGISTFSDIQLP